jgi:DNA-binding XRE family transcriptional regulator
MYRNVRAMMAKYDINMNELAKMLNISTTSMSNKMNGHNDFLLKEAKSIINYFNDKGENLTTEELFFTQVSPIVNDKE